MNHLLVWYTIRLGHASIGMVEYTISLDRDFFWKNNSKYYLWDYEMNHFLVSYTIWIVQTSNEWSKMYHFTWQRLFNQNVIVNITFEIVKWAIWQLEFLECSRTIWGTVYSMLWSPQNIYLMLNNTTMVHCGSAHR